MKKASVIIVLKDTTKIQFDCISCSTISMVFSRINETLILKNKKDTDILQMRIIFKEV